MSSYNNLALVFPGALHAPGDYCKDESKKINPRPYYFIPIWTTSLKVFPLLILMWNLENNSSLAIQKAVIITLSVLFFLLSFQADVTLRAWHYGLLEKANIRTENIGNIDETIVCFILTLISRLYMIFICF